MNTMLTKEEFNKANNGFIHVQSFMQDYIYNDNEELFLKLKKVIDKNIKYPIQSFRIILYNHIISENRIKLSFIQEHILEHWIETFIDAEDIYYDMKIVLETPGVEFYND
jgi:hypothetical protein